MTTTMNCEFCGKVFEIGEKLLKLRQVNGASISCGKCFGSGRGRGAKMRGLLFMADGKPWNFIDEKAVTSKLCRKCKNVKPLSDFYVMAGCVMGRSSKCKECSRKEVTCPGCGTKRTIRGDLKLRTGYCRKCWSTKCRVSVPVDTYAPNPRRLEAANGEAHNVVGIGPVFYTENGAGAEFVSKDGSVVADFPHHLHAEAFLTVLDGANETGS